MTDPSSTGLTSCRTPSFVTCIPSRNPLSGSVNVSKRQNPMFRGAIAGFRNVIVHEYLGIDLEVIWSVVDRDLPGLEPAVDRMIRAVEDGRFETGSFAGSGQYGTLGADTGWSTLQTIGVLKGTKLIEVASPLDAINVAAARAVLFAQAVEHLTPDSRE